jgi:hypothetical protein
MSSTSLQTLNVPYSFTTARHSSNSETNATKAGEGEVTVPTTSQSCPDCDPNQKC